MVKPSTSTRTTRKIGRSGDRRMRVGESRKPTKTEIPAARFPSKHVRLEGMGFSRTALHRNALPFGQRFLFRLDREGACPPPRDPRGRAIHPPPRPRRAV